MTQHGPHLQSTHQPYTHKADLSSCITKNKKQALHHPIHIVEMAGVSILEMMRG